MNMGMGMAISME